MNGKLIYKRKRDEQESTTENNTKRERFDVENQRPSVINVHHGQATPPPSPPRESTHEDSAIIPTTKNKILFEALQKIIELQKELDEFENDLDYNDEHGLPDEEDEDSEVSFYLNEHNQQIERQCQKHEAEALGFAMCARETLLFLEREGIPQDSAIYKTLREKLVGQVEDSIPI